MRVTIITAIYDDYDTLKQPVEQEGADVDYVCVTDRPRDDAGRWRVVVEPRPAMHPNVAAKRPKMLPWEYTDNRWSIWLDASFAITSESFVTDVVDHVDLDGGPGLAQFKHPWRDCVYDEAAASLALPKYEGIHIEQQMLTYRSWGHPEHWGLWSTGLIVRSLTDDVKKLGRRWLQTCQEWSYQDQLSEAPHLRALGVRPSEIPGSHLNNPWVQYQGSARH